MTHFVGSTTAEQRKKLLDLLRILSVPTWTKWNDGLAWLQLTIERAVASLQKSLQFKYKFGAFMAPQLKFLPSGTISKACNRISLSSSTWCCDASADVWRSGCDEGSFTGMPGLQSSPLPSSSRCAVLLVSLLGLDVTPEASLVWLLLEDKSLLPLVSSMDTWKKINLAILKESLI